MKKMRKILILVLLCVCSARAWGAETSDLDKAVANEESRMRLLEQKVEEHRRNAEQIGKQEKSVLGELTKLEQNTAIISQQSKVLSAKAQKLKAEIDKLNREIETTRARIGDISSILSQRFLSMSRYGEMEHIQLLLSSQSTHDAINSIYLLNQLAVGDQKLIEELFAKEKELSQTTENLTKSKEQFTAQSAQLKNKQTEYQGAITTTNKFLDDVRKQKNLQEQAAREAEAAQREIGRTISALMKRKRDRLERERREQLERNKRAAEELAKYGKTNIVTTPVQPQKQYTYLATGSMLEWPLPTRGELSSPFGNRIHPVFKTKSSHSGLDLSAPAGTPVKAAGPGEVLYAGWQRGFGQVIIIDHGRDISTVYAHLSSMNVNEGDAVRAGTQIGSVGRTGTTTGYHLHFEVRVGTAAKDPLRYLKR